MTVIVVIIIIVIAVIITIIIVVIIIIVIILVLILIVTISSGTRKLPGHVCLPLAASNDEARKNEKRKFRAKTAPIEA